ncbi:hypothetical protein CDL15_Pgr020897 [Punica granatum]|uniref:Fe2OG dioxygenase domain-containing protein n=1 Tax=Punica granatum TaxID=22663 RepID=A0A218XVF1_PUNGR|nr:hypothetical protein CDL15_Pgr020897 [Punica granatum]
MDENSRVGSGDTILSRYDPSELRVATEFLANWFPFLSASLCPGCARSLSDRIRSIDPGVNSDVKTPKPDQSAFAVMTPDVKAADLNCGHTSSSSDSSEGNLVDSPRPQERVGTSSLGRFRGTSFRSFKLALANTMDPRTRETRVSEGPILSPQALGFDMEEEDALKDEKSPKSDRGLMVGDIRLIPSGMKRELSREQREYIRFMNVKRNKELVCFEKVKGRRVNVLEGLELHTGIFSAAEQRRIVDFISSPVYKLTISYNPKVKDLLLKLAIELETINRKFVMSITETTRKDKCGNPPGILHNEFVDPLPSLLKIMIKRLIRWHVLPHTCVPDSCIINIYEEGDCIPPHIDNHDFVRPFCTVSFLSECKILFGSRLEVLSPGEFSGPFALPLPVGSVLVLKGNGADIAKHCVPAVPTKRISITFRRMDESKRPSNYLPDPDLLAIQPLTYEVSDPKTPSLSSTPESQTRRRLPRTKAHSGGRRSSGRSGSPLRRP